MPIENYYPSLQSFKPNYYQQEVPKKIITEQIKLNTTLVTDAPKHITTTSMKNQHVEKPKGVDLS